MCPCFTHSKALAKAQPQGPAASVAGRVLPRAGVESRELRITISQALRHRSRPTWGLARTTEIAGSDDAVASTLAMCQGLWVPRLVVPTMAPSTGSPAEPEETVCRLHWPVLQSLEVPL